MVFKLLSTTLLLLSLSSLAVQACPVGNPNNLAYMRRDNNRCEGIRDRNINAGVQLVAFFTTNLRSYSNTLMLRVPGTGKTPPILEMQAAVPNYILDNLQTQPTSSGYTFSLNTKVLQRAKIPLSRLQPLAYTLQNSSPIFYPVVLGEPSGKYVFRLYSSGRVRLPTLEIRRNNSRVKSFARNVPRQGYMTLEWDYRTAPAGTYELLVIDDQNNRLSFRFQHNPSW